MSGIIDQFGLKIPKVLVPKSNGKKLVPRPDSEDVIIQQTMLTNPYDWFGFPNAAINPANGDIAVVHNEAQGHGQPALGNRLVFSRDGGQTWEQSKSMSTPGHGKLGHLWRGNRMLFYHYNTETYAQELRYSDDEGDTFSDWQTTFELYTDPGQLFGPGDPIRYKDWYLKPLYGRPTNSGPRHILIIGNNGNGEGAYELYSVPVRLSDAGNYDNPEEPGIVVHPSGVMLCYFRTGEWDDSEGVWVTRSLDGGKHWDKPRFAFPSWGRAGVGVSENGTICLLGRAMQFAGRTIYAWSNDVGETHHWDNFDDREDNMQAYGVPIWDKFRKRFIAVYGSDTNFPNGPAFTLCKFIDEVDE